MLTKKQLDKIRRSFGPNNPEPLDLESIVNEKRKERWCRDCNSLFTPQEQHHRLCRNCWQIREFPYLFRVKGARGRVDDDD